MLGLANQWLTVRQNILCWPIGIASVVLYVFVFYDAKLYSDVLLQGIYVCLQLYGWRNWLRLRSGDSAVLSRRRLPVTQLGAQGWIIVTAILISGTTLLGSVMARYTDAAMPVPDALATTLSLTAQWLQARKVLESWLVFIVANGLFIAIYWTKGLYVTIGLFTVLTVLAVVGFLQWRMSLRMS